MNGLPNRSSTKSVCATSTARLPVASGVAGFIDVQLQSLCRICAKLGDSMVDIYDQIFAEDYRPALDQWINDYLPITVTQMDAMPLKVCTKCSQILLAFHQLYLRCLESKQRFEVMLNHHPEVQTQQDHGEADCAPNGSSELTMGSIMDGILVDEADFLHYDEADKLLEADEEPDDTGGTSRNSTLKNESLEIKSIEMYSHAMHLKLPAIKNDSVVTKNVIPPANPSDSVMVEQYYVNDLDKTFIETTKVTAADGKLLFQCPQCTQRLSSARALINHTRLHTNRRPFQCLTCGTYFRTDLALGRHIRSVHQSLRPHICTKCGHSFAHKHNLDEHQRLHTQERRYACPECGKKFAQKSGLFNHRRTHSIDSTGFKCDICARPFATSISLGQHVATHTGDRPFECDICGRCFRVGYEMRLHRRVHSEAKQYGCVKCGIRFRQKRYLVKHCRSYHDEGILAECLEASSSEGKTTRNKRRALSISKDPQPTLDSYTHPSGRRLRHKHVCAFCKQGLHTKQRLIQHLRDTHSDQIFHCDVCDEYVDRQELIVHMTTHALAIENSESINCGTTATTSTELEPPTSTDVPITAPAVAPITCDQCPKTFANRSSKRYHMLSVHQQQRDFCCTQCDRTFVCKRTLTNHVNSIHESDRTYTCDACPKAFKTDSGLYAHRKRLHSDAAGSSAAAFAGRCEFCFKKFKFRGDLTRHMAMHTKETKFFCQYCNKGFGVRNNLTKHLRTHSSLLDYKCHICSYAAVQRRYLAEHMKSAHQTVLRTNESLA